MSAPLERTNTIAFACGPKGSGKSHLLDEYFTTKYDGGVIRLDFVGDVAEKYPDMVEVVGLRQLLLQLREFAAMGAQRWDIVAAFPERLQWELPILFELLVPPYEGRNTRGGLSRSFGGLALECSECDIILPNHNGADYAPMRNAVKRARHERLDLYLGTQRPQECHRLCTSQADYVIAFAMHEPRELDYLAKGVGEEYADRVRDLPRFHSMWFSRRTNSIVERDKNGAIVESE